MMEAGKVKLYPVSRGDWCGCGGPPEAAVYGQRGLAKQSGVRHSSAPTLRGRGGIGASAAAVLEAVPGLVLTRFQYAIVFGRDKR